MTVESGKGHLGPEFRLPIRITIPYLGAAGLAGIDSLRSFHQRKYLRTVLSATAALVMGRIGIDSRGQGMEQYALPPEGSGMLTKALGVIAKVWVTTEEPAAMARSKIIDTVLEGKNRISRFLEDQQYIQP